MSNILDGMTREQALGCVKRIWGELAVLVVGDTCYANPILRSDACAAEGRICNTSYQKWIDHINAHYDALEAEAKKPKWNVPALGRATLHYTYYCGNTGGIGRCGTEELLPIDDMENEIARTNARRKIEAFRDANCKSGEWYIEYDHDSCKFVVIFHGRNSLGAISFSDPKCAEECIRRFHEELKLLSGVHS